MPFRKGIHKLHTYVYRRKIGSLLDGNGRRRKIAISKWSYTWAAAMMDKYDLIAEIMCFLVSSSENRIIPASWLFAEFDQFYSLAFLPNSTFRRRVLSSYIYWFYVTSYQICQHDIANWQHTHTQNDFITTKMKFIHFFLMRSHQRSGKMGSQPLFCLRSFVCFFYLRQSRKNNLWTCWQNQMNSSLSNGFFAIRNEERQIRFILFVLIRLFVCPFTQSKGEKKSRKKNKNKMKKRKPNHAKPNFS